MKPTKIQLGPAKTHFFTLLLIFTGIFSITGQNQIFFDGGPYTYTNTDTITEDIFAGIDVSSCSSFQINIEYSFSLPWEGSGNMETSDDCGTFPPPCPGDPNNPEEMGCAGCWDFLWARILADGTEIGSDLIGDAGTTDLEQSGVISFTICNSNYSSLDIEIYSQTWAANESVTFSNIEVLCWDDQPLADATPNPVCENESVQLDELNGNFINWDWAGPAGFTSNMRSPTINNFTTTNEGIYTVTVADMNGCFLSADIEILLAPAPSINTGVMDEQCGPTPAIFDLTLLEDQLNSDPSIVFEWYETMSGIPQISNPASYSSSGGTIYVAALDPNNGCYSDTVAVVLSILPQPTFSVPSDVTVCEGLQVDLDTLINPSNTNLTYTYHDGVPPTSANQISGVTSFNNNTVISVVGTDANNCSDTQYVNLETIEVPLAPPASSTGPYCEGEDILLQADPPIIPLITYIWSGPNGFNALGPTQTIPNSTVNDAGDYVLIATFAGCSSQPTIVSVTVNPLPSESVVTDPVNVCFGSPIQLDAMSDPGSVYSWNGPNGFFSIEQNPLVTTQADYSHEGIYIVTPTLNGCTGPSSEVNVDVLDTPQLTLQIDQGILCAGGSTGSISVDVSNSPPPYTYDWEDNQFDGMNVISGLSEGTYSVTVTDGNGCSSTASIFLDDPDPINLFCDQEQPVSASGASDGVGNVFIQFGAEPFELFYDNSNGTSGTLAGLTDGSTLISGLEEGTYQVTVTDANGCTATCEFIIGSGNCSIAISNIFQIDSILCHGDSTASVEVEVAMGSGNYIYEWENNVGGQISDSSKAVNLPAGVYYISVQDANDPSCTAFSSITVSQPPFLDILNCSESLPPSMSGSNDGEAVINWEGGISPYTIFSSGTVTDTFLISNDSLVIDSLPEGDYTIVVVDNNGCMDSCSFSIQSASCELEIELDTAYFSSCPSDSSLNISLSVMNQSPNTIYIWNGDTSDQITKSGLPEGMYLIEAIDTVSNCSDQLNLDLSYNTPLTFACNVLQQPSSPDSANGKAEIIFSSIQKPYELYLRGPTFPIIIPDLQQDTFEIFDLDTGRYTVIVTDSLGCVDSCIFNLVSNSCNLKLAIDTTYFESCPEDSSLYIEVSVNQTGTQIIYQLNSDTFSTGIFTDLAEGIYTLIAIDTLTGCSDTLVIDRSINIISSFNCTVFSIPSAVGSRDGIGGIIIDSIRKPYSVNITSFNYSRNRNNLTSDTVRFNNLDSGLYLITVTDSLGCKDTCSFYLPDGGCDIFSIDSIRTIQPACSNGLNGEIQLYVSGGSGNYNYDWNVDSLDGNALITDLRPGVYRVTVTDNDLGCVVQGQRTLFPGENIDIDFSHASTFCENDSVEVSFSIQSGVPPFIMQINNGSPFTFLNDTSIWISSGNPAVEISDENQCTQIDTLDITQENPITLNLDSTLCVGSILEVGNEIFDENRMRGQVVLDGAANNGCDSIINVKLEFEDPELAYEVLGPSCTLNQNSRIRIISWSGQGDFTLYLDGQQIPNPSLPFIVEDLNTGVHELYAESNLQCRTATQIIQVDAPEHPEVNIAEVGSIEPGDSVLLEGSTSAIISQINWMPSNIVLCDTCLSTLAYPSVTTTLVLTVQDSMGCRGEAEITVVVTEDEFAWYIPNAFTPNGDGLNDQFTIYGDTENGQIDQFMIFDRWGNALFERRDISIGIENLGWDGTAKGREMDPGVYIYSMEVTTAEGEKLYFKGSVMLLK